VKQINPNWGTNIVSAIHYGREMGLADDKITKDLKKLGLDDDTIKIYFNQLGGYLDQKAVEPFVEKDKSKMN
jgi:hypothetical protein